MGLNGTGVPARTEVPTPGGSHAALYRSQSWHVAYMAALFEADRAKIGERITCAEQLILLRERELFTARVDPAE